MNHKKAVSFLTLTVIGAFFILINAPLSSATLQDKLIGKWVGDAQALAADPSVKKSPRRKNTAFMSRMKLTFTADTQTLDIGGFIVSEKYKVVSVKPHSLIIKNLTGKKKGKQSTITFIDDNHISIKQIGKHGPPLYFKR